MASNERILRRIVVGTDGSEHAATALRWAVAEAAVHDAQLEVVYVWSFLNQMHVDDTASFEPDYDEERARRSLGDWIARHAGEDAAAGIAHRVVLDAPDRALLEAGDAADLLVLGARGTGEFEGLLVGSVSDRVAQLAAGPVAVVRSEAPVAGGRIVAGIDGSARSTLALRWAAREARARGASLDVVHSSRLSMVAAPFVHGGMPALSAMEDADRAILDAATSDDALTGVPVRAHLSSDSPARALVEIAGGADLVVVGTRGLGRVAGTLLGSVSRQVLHHAPCPVVVL